MPMWPQPDDGDVCSSWSVPVQCITAQIYALHASFGIKLNTTAVHFSYALFCFFALFQIVKIIKVLKQTIGMFSYTENCRSHINKLAHTYFRIYDMHVDCQRL